jgi:putative transposase
VTVVGFLKKWVFVPWKVKNEMKLREEFVLESLEPGVNLSALCRRYEVSRKTGYKWKLQYEKEGLVGL